MQENTSRPHESVRIRPRDALDLGGLVRELAWSAVARIEASSRPWSVLSVFSPYTPNAHVMLMESSVDRYLPGPEWIPDEEGDALMPRIARILEFFEGRSENASLHAGYNWSPRSWGEHEERTGFQSISTKWHPMLWGWPALDEAAKKEEGGIEWIGVKDLSAEERRLFGENDYGGPLCQLIRSSLETVFAGRTGGWGEIFDFGRAELDTHTLVIPFRVSLSSLFRAPRFFREIMKPVAVALEGVFRKLTETLTHLDCAERDRLLQRCESEGGAVWSELQRPPTLRDETGMRSRAKAEGLSQDLLDVLIPPVSRRCHEIGDPFHWWRVGFGYALCFSSGVGDRLGQIKIMPGVFVGPGGIVETQSVILHRPEFVPNNANILRKSALLWNLGRELGSDQPK